jgi:hypothetical protein
MMEGEISEHPGIEAMNHLRIHKLQAGFSEISEDPELSLFEIPVVLMMVCLILVRPEPFVAIDPDSFASGELLPVSPIGDERPVRSEAER